jgi:hypothetical protein
VLLIRNRKDPAFSRIRIWDQFPGVLRSGSISYANEHNEITGRENLAKFAFWLDPVGPTDKENQVKMYKKKVQL